MAIRFRSLRATLLIPFVALVVAVAAAVTWSSYSTGLRAVDEVSRRLLEDVANRLAQATRQHMATSAVVLNAVAPDANSPGPDPEFAALSPTMISEFEKRLWLASGLYPDRNSYVYYGSETGRFVGIQRDAPGGAEIRIRAQPTELRRVYRAISPEQRGELLREEQFNPHDRPWYRLTRERKSLTWTPVYRDFNSGQRIITLAKPVFRPDGSIRGVAATDVSLTRLVEFVRSLSISQNGIAYVLEPDGNVVASSMDPTASAVDTASSVASAAEGHAIDTRAAASASVLVRESYRWLTEHLPAENAKQPATAGVALTPVQHAQYDGELGPTHLSVISYKDHAGLNWRFIVASPRSDHMGPVYRAMRESVAIGGLAVLLALLLGTWVFHRVAEDVIVVSRAAQRLATGEGPITRIPDSEDEIGALGSSVAAIQDALLYDRLTGALNRSAFEQRFSAAVGDMRNSEPLAIVYIDLDRFKKINDRYGHAVGDAVLAKSAERIRRRLRDQDSFARFGGDEFVVMVRGHAAVSGIDALVTRLGERLRMGMNVGEHHVAVGASIGVAIFPDDGRTLDELISVADSRMYGEKRKTAEVRKLRKAVSYISVP